MPMTRASNLRVTLPMAYLAIGALLVVVHATLETGSLPQSLLYDVIGASAVTVALIGVWRNKPDRATPWILMAIGQALFVAGDLLWNWYEVIGEDPFPSMADVLYLAGYPFIALGLLMMIRRRVGGGDRGGALDAAILTTAAAILSWTFLIQPQLVGSELDSTSLLITLAYPVADLILIGVAMGLLTTPGARTPSFQMLALSLGLMLVADQIYAIQNLDGTYVSGGPIDTLYLIAYLLFGAAAAHPSMRRLTEPHPVPVTWLGPVRLACLAAAMITGPLLVTLGPGTDGGLAVVAAGTAVLSLLVLARLAGLVGMLARDVAQRRALEAQLSYQAFHDPLTGLSNRRRFVEAAEKALEAKVGTGSVAALFLDLDDFKTVNDSLGHAAGDSMLIAVAARLRSDLRASDVAGRLGGDEFGVLLTDLPDEAYAVAVAERLLARLVEPIEVAGVSIEVGASIGIAIVAAGVGTVDDLLGDADVAMYQAKARGKGRYQVFDAAQRRGTGRPGPRLGRARPDRPPARVDRHRTPGARGGLDSTQRPVGPPIAPNREARSMEIPLFPLHTVLCPGIVLPLHVFEDRYRALTRHCLDTGDPFGVVLIRDGQEVGPSRTLALAAVGALVEIREAGRYPDGRYDLLAAATGRFAIDTVDPAREPYLVADVTPLEDEVGDEARAERLAASAIRRFVRYLELMRARDGETSEVLDIRVEVETAPFESDDSDEATDDDDDITDDDIVAAIEDAAATGVVPEPIEPRADDDAGSSSGERRRDLVIPDDPTVLSHLLSGIIGIELPRRQALLEAHTTVERLEALIRLLDRELLLLTSRLRLFSPDQRLLRGPRRS